VNAKKTKPITFATLTEFFGILIVLMLSVKLLSAVGAIAATAAFLLGRICANIYLAKPVIRVIKGFSEHP
jgi:hypothetical protein